MTETERRLFEMADPDYKRFMSKLVPTVAEEDMVGVRLPALRKLAGEMRREGTAKDFMERLPHRYYEENMLHAVLIGGMRDGRECLGELERFLPFVDNWAVCDSMRPKVLASCGDEAMGALGKWMADGHVYTRRFAMEIMMSYFPETAFRRPWLETAMQGDGGDYYLRMMKAWYLAEGLAVKWEDTLPWLLNDGLDAWVRNKAIQKAVESRRVPEERKRSLREMKVKYDNKR